MRSWKWKRSPPREVWRKAPGKWSSRRKGPEAGPAGRKGSPMNGEKASTRRGWVSKQKPECADFILVQQEGTRRSQAEQRHNLIMFLKITLGGIRSAERTT